MRIVIAGAGLAGLAAAKYLSDAGHTVTLLDKRSQAGGKVSSWQDADGDWLESGLHVFFGAYRHLRRLLTEVGLEDRLAWKAHEMTFSRPGGLLSPLQFSQRLPAPWHGLLAGARSDERRCRIAKDGRTCWGGRVGEGSLAQPAGAENRRAANHRGSGSARGGCYSQSRSGSGSPPSSACVSGLSGAMP